VVGPLIVAVVEEGIGRALPAGDPLSSPLLGSFRLTPLTSFCSSICGGSERLRRGFGRALPQFLYLRWRGGSVPRRVMCRSHRRCADGGLFRHLEGGSHSVPASRASHCLCLLSSFAGSLVRDCLSRRAST
jgi:hypothetical protein